MDYTTLTPYTPPTTTPPSSEDGIGGLVLGKPQFQCTTRMITWKDIFKLRILNRVRSTNQRGELTTLLQFHADDLPGWIRDDLQKFWTLRNQAPPYQGRVVYLDSESKDTKIYSGIIRLEMPKSLDPNTILWSSPAWPENNPSFGTESGYSMCPGWLWMVLPIYFNDKPMVVTVLELSRHLQPPCA